MAINQILDYNDEILDGTPRYNITNNPDGTKGIELANDIVQEGTLINRNTFNKISNVLSYLTPSVEKVAGTPTPTTSQLFGVGADGSTNTEYTNNCTPFSDGDVPTITYYISKIGNGSAGISTWTKSQLDTVFYRTTYGQYRYWNGGSAHYVIFDMKKQRKATLNYYCTSSSGNVHLYGSNDNVSYTDLATLTKNSLQTYDITTGYRYYKLTATNSFNFYVSYFTNVEDTITEYQNQFTLDNNENAIINPDYFVKNQLNKNWVVSQDGLSMTNDDGIEITVPSVVSIYPLINIADENINTRYASDVESAGTTRNILIDFKSNYKLKSVSTFHPREKPSVL